MKTRSVVLLCAAALALASFANVAQAQGSFVVNVVNPSFETGPYGVTPAGWTLVQPNLASFQLNSQFDSSAPDGQYSATGTGGSSGWVYQAVGSLLAGYDYQLTVSTFRPENMFGAEGTGFVSLSTDNSTLASIGSAGPVAGVWTDRSVVVTASQIASQGLAGQSLIISLGTGPSGMGPFHSFDNVRLTAVLVPEPTTGMLGLVGCVALFASAKRRKQS